MPNIVTGRIEERDRQGWPERVRVVLARGWSVATLIVVAAALVVALALSVNPVDTESTTASGVEPAVVEHPAGMSVARLRLTERAVERVGIRTAPVAARSSGRTQRLAVPYGALLYDGDGKTWVYTSPEPRVYVRAAVVVDTIDGQTALLARGPAEGTDVVNVGAQELFGTEFGVDH